MAGWTRLARSGVVIAAGIAALAFGDASVAQEFPATSAPQPRPTPQRLIVRNVEGHGTYRSVVHSLRQWRGQNNAITTENVECDIAAEFRGDGDATVNGTILFRRETIRDGRVIGRTEVRGSGNNILARRRLNIGYVPGQPGGMMWARWTGALEVPVEISIGDNAPIGHTQYCETRLKDTGRPYPLQGSHAGPLRSVDVLFSRPFAQPGGQMLQFEQTVQMTWNFAPLYQQ